MDEFLIFYIHLLSVLNNMVSKPLYPIDYARFFMLYLFVALIYILLISAYCIYSSIVLL